MPFIPSYVKLLIFDLDGVVVQTAQLHALAWETMFNEFIRNLNRVNKSNIPPFKINPDYYKYLNGIPRLDGIKNFLQSRNILFQTGKPDDGPGLHSMYALGNMKNNIFNDLLVKEGVKIFPEAVNFISKARDLNLLTSLITSSKNGRHILSSAGLEKCFDSIIDGNDAEKRNIKGKPAPDIFIAAAGDCEVPPEHSAVFEDALAGIEAAVNGNFGYVVAVDRGNEKDAFIKAGANIVINNFNELNFNEHA